MSDKFSIPIPPTHLTWNLYGKGYDNFGRYGKPERVSTSLPGPDHLLVRIDSVGICYSDVKLLNQGNAHPKILNRNLISNPTRPGHEISFTVVSVGSHLETLYQIGERYAIQPEVILDDKKETYGFSLPGGLAQFQLIGPELLETDQGPSILKLDSSMGYAEAALLEPWGSVLAAYSENRRLFPKNKGKMWVLGGASSGIPYAFSRYLDLPEYVLVTDLPEALESVIRASARKVYRADGISYVNYKDLMYEKTGGEGFDDIIILDPASGDQVQQLISLVNPGGLVNLVGTRPLGEKVAIDPQRTHYEFVALVGNSSLDIAASYGPSRNRSDFLPNGTAVLFGGGGPMGQLHLQRALTMQDGPQTILVCEVNQQRMEYLKARFTELARKNGKKLIVLDLEGDPSSAVQAKIRNITGDQTADDLIVLVPRQEVLDQAAVMIQDQSLINLFAGTPAGLYLNLDLSKVYLGNLQITGASGLSMDDYRSAYEWARRGEIDLNTSVAAVGGMRAASQAIQASAERRYPGKIVIYPQLEHLPLLDNNELAVMYPDLKSRLGDQHLWTREAELKLFELAGK